jgi:autotransporter-associated beta strand protein
MVTGGTIQDGTLNLAASETLTAEIPSAQATISAALTGSGSVLTAPPSGQTGSGILILASWANDYTGGTMIDLHSTLQLQTDASTKSGALLGTGPVAIVGTLDLNGCPLTLTALSGDGEITDSSSNIVAPS